MGEAYLTRAEERYHAYSSEGGHADFAPNDELESGLLHYLRQQFGHVSWERVCSGTGIPNFWDSPEWSRVCEMKFDPLEWGTS